MAKLMSNKLLYSSNGAFGNKKLKYIPEGFVALLCGNPHVEAVLHRRARLEGKRSRFKDLVGQSH